MMASSILPRCIKLLTALTVLLAIKATTCGGSPTRSLAPKIRIEGESVSFSVTNTGSSPGRFFNCFKRKFPGYAWIAARDSKKVVLTRTIFSPDGYWSPASRVGLGVLLPVRLDVIEAGETIRKDVNITEMLLELQLDELQADRIKDRTVEVKFRFQVFADQSLSEAIEVETEWVPYKLR